MQTKILLKRVSECWVSSPGEEKGGDRAPDDTLGCGLSSKDQDKQSTGQDSAATDAAQQRNVKSGQIFTVKPESGDLI